MPLRKGHGINANNQPVVIETLPPDELPRPDPEKIQARIAMPQGKPFQKGNKAGIGAKPKMAKLGINPNKINAKDPEYKQALLDAEGYRRYRLKEMRKIHGYVSVAAMSLIATSSLQLAASRYFMSKGIQSGDLDLVKKGSSLANEARQNELAAFELGSREAGSKARAMAAQVPWVRVDVPAEEKALPEEVKHPWEEPIAEPKRRAYVSPPEQENKSNGNAKEVPSDEGD